MLSYSRRLRTQNLNSQDLISLGSGGVSLRGALEAAKPPPPCQSQEVATEEDLDRDACPLSSEAGLAALSMCPRLPRDGALDVDVEVREVEVRRERLPHNSVRPAFEDEGVRLVLPTDAVRVVQAGELALHRMRERVNGLFIRGHDEIFPALLSR